MKKSIVLLVTIVITIVSVAQTKFEKVMLANIDSLYKSFGTGQIVAPINMFERIATIDTMRWEPLYYAAYGCCMLSMREQDAVLKEAWNDKAQSFLDKAFKVSPDESELYVMQGFVYNMRLLVNPAMRGSEYFGKINESYAIAERLNPENPRVHFMKATLIMNVPPFMGGGKDKALPIFELAIQKFNTFTSTNALAPRWGRESCEQKLDECKTN